MEKRLMRLIWNDNNWEKPMKRKYDPTIWKSENKNKSFEKAFGFGGEDWLFNSRYNLNGQQYGYIRGVDRLSSDDKFIDELFLYTIESNTKKRLLVLKIKDVEIIKSYGDTQEIISPILKQFHQQHIDELKSVDAYHQALDKFKLHANVRFRIENITNYGYFNEIEEFKKHKFDRFTPIIVDKYLESIIINNIINPAVFCFRKGKSKSVIAHHRVRKCGFDFNIRLHSDITEDLEIFLLEVKSIKKEDVSIEKSLVGGRIIDGVIQNSNKYSFFEIKTSSTATSNIRDAIGQLIEYSHLDKNINIEKLIIVGPATMNFEEKLYFNRIKNTLNVNLEYWAYKMNEKNIEDKFVIF